MVHAPNSRKNGDDGGEKKKSQDEFEKRESGCSSDHLTTQVVV